MINIFTIFGLTVIPSKTHNNDNIKKICVVSSEITNKRVSNGSDTKLLKGHMARSLDTSN